MPLTKQQVEHVATLARLSLSPAEVEEYRSQLSTILAHVELLQELDVTGVPPTTHAVELLSTPLRADEPRPCLTVEQALQSAPAKADGAFLVPRILE